MHTLLCCFCSTNLTLHLSPSISQRILNPSRGRTDCCAGIIKILSFLSSYSARPLHVYLFADQVWIAKCEGKLKKWIQLTVTTIVCLKKRATCIYCSEFLIKKEITYNNKCFSFSLLVPNVTSFSDYTPADTSSSVHLDLNFSQCLIFKLIFNSFKHFHIKQFSHFTSAYTYSEIAGKMWVLKDVEFSASFTNCISTATSTSFSINYF